MDNRGMTEIVKTITELVRGAILVFGINIILYGHLTPGGGFAGGLITAFLFILLFLSFGKQGALERMPLPLAHILDSVGIIAFLFLGTIGLFMGGSFLFNFARTIFRGADFNLVSAGFIPLENIAIGLKVGASIFLVFAVLSIFRTGQEE
jgi:multicomponent Na+:H+ antiporter subunit B